MTESYFVSCPARAEMSVRVSVSAVGNVDVPVADLMITILSHHIVIVCPGSFNSNVSRPTTEGGIGQLTECQHLARAE